MNAKFGGFRDGHDGHDAGLNGVGDDEIGGVGDASGHVETDDEEALGADLADGLFDFAAHEGTGEDEGAGPREAGDGADGVGEGPFTDEWDGVDGDVFAADVVPVGFADGADGDLSDLGAAAHDDDPLAVDLLEAFLGGDVADGGEGLHLGEEGFRGGLEVDFEVDARFVFDAAFEHLNGDNIAVVSRDHARQAV